MAKTRGDEPGKANRTQEPEEFRRFEDLARKLTKVPKAEIDAERNGSKRPARRSARRR